MDLNKNVKSSLNSVSPLGSLTCSANNQNNIQEEKVLSNEKKIDPDIETKVLVSQTQSSQKNTKYIDTNKKFKIFCKDHIPVDIKNLQKHRNKITFEQISCFSQLLKENWKQSKYHNSQHLFKNNHIIDQNLEESEHKSQEFSSSSTNQEMLLGFDEKMLKLRKNLISQVRNQLYKVSNLNIFVSKKFTFEKQGDRSKNSAEQDLYLASEGRPVGQQMIRKREYNLCDHNNIETEISYEATLDKEKFPWDLIKVDDLSKEEIMELYQKFIPNNRLFEKYIVVSSSGKLTKRKKMDWEKSSYHQKRNKIRVEELKKSQTLKSLKSLADFDNDEDNVKLWCYCQKPYDDEKEMISNLKYLLVLI